MAMTSDPGRDGHPVDEFVRYVRERFIRRTDATFDFEAGLADVRERAGLDPVLVPAPGAGPQPMPPATAAIEWQIGELQLALTALTAPGRWPDAASRDVQQAIEIVARLRDGLDSGTVARSGADASVRLARALLRRVAAQVPVAEAEARLADLERAIAAGADGPDRARRAPARLRPDQARRARKAGGN
jgi:hypothetical protein